MCSIKSRHGVLESNFSLWYSTSTDHRSDKIQKFLWSAPSFLPKLHGMRYSLNSGMSVGISFIVLLKGKDCYGLLYLPINDFATTILKSSKEIEVPSFVDTM